MLRPCRGTLPLRGARPRRRRVAALVVTHAGVRSLTRFLSENRAAAGAHVALSSLPRGADGRVPLVADGASLAFFLLGERRGPPAHPGGERAMAAWHLGGEYRELAAKTRRARRCRSALSARFTRGRGCADATPAPAALRRRFAAGLRAAGVALTCVFDPAPLTSPESARKLGAWGARTARATLAVGELAALVATAGRPPATRPAERELNVLDSTPPPELFMEQVKRALAAEGVSLVVSLAAEADDQLVACVRAGAAYAVLSSDSDFGVAEGCRLMPLTMLDSAALLGGDDAAAAAACAWVFEPRAVAHALGLRSVAALFEVCCLVGQDATGELCDKLRIMQRLGLFRSRGTAPVALAAAWAAEQRAARADEVDAAEVDEVAAEHVLLEQTVPLLCGMEAEDAAAWVDAVRASRRFYLLPSADVAAGAAGGAAASSGGSLTWLAALPLRTRDVAAAVVRDALPTWALAVAAHGQSWAPGVSYERPWGGEAGGGTAAAHRPLRARLYAALGAPPGAPVTEHAWSGAWWGAGVARVPVPPDAAAAAAAAAAGEADAAAGHAWARLRAMLHAAPPPPLQPLQLQPACSDPALALPQHEGFAALVLRYFFSLRLVSGAAIVRRLTAWQAAAAVAVMASQLALDAAVRAGAAPEPPPAEWQPPPWRCLELSALLQSSVAAAYAAADVAGPPGARRAAPPPAALFSGSELLRLYELSEANARIDPAPAADAAAWPPAWWAAHLTPHAAAIALRISAAALHGLPQGVLAGAAPDAGEPSAIDELLQRFASGPQFGLRVADDASSVFGGIDEEDDDAIAPPPEPAMGTSAPADVLPVDEHIPALLSLAAAHRVVCISGATGCGKSTVVPMALLNASGGRGRIIVTQPRRIAAVSLARRVASTLKEPLGRTVGFAIGQERAVSSHTRLTYVTTGWLLRVAASSRSAGPGAFAHATHIVLDEAHDRSLDADFLSLLLKRRMAAPGARPPKLVVMSATLQANVFGPYFGAGPDASGGAADVAEPPVLHVGARRFPVQEVYLDEIGTALGVKRPALLAAAAAEAADSEAMLSDAAARRGRAGGSARRSPRASRRLLDVAVQLAMHTARPGGTVLVFLPGAAEIEAAQQALLAREAGRAPLEVFALHSLVPRELQAAALEPPTPGRARILLSTDIAESSLTLPDVTVVIDACLRRGPEWSEARQMTSFNTAFASRASLAQRAGRAGRVQPGVAVRLLPRKAAALLPEHDPPEMQCVALDGVVLRAKHLLAAEAASVQALLAGAVSPPPPARVDASLARLAAGGALTHAGETGRLTALGAFAAALPQLPLPVARALLLGVAAGAAPEAVLLAAALTLENSPFKQVLPMFAASPAAYAAGASAATRARLAADAGRYSEPLAWAALYRQWAGGAPQFGRAAWRRVRAQLGARAMRAFATAVRALARDVPRAAAAAGAPLPTRQAARLAALAGAAALAGGSELDDDEPPFEDALDADATSAAAASTAASAPEVATEALLRLLAVAAAGPNLLQATRRAAVGDAVAEALKVQGVAWERCVALQPPAWLRERGPAALRESLAAALASGPGSPPNGGVERIADASLTVQSAAGADAAAAAADADDPTGPRLSRRAGRPPGSARGGADAWFVQLAAEGSHSSPYADGHHASSLISDALPPSAKCLLSLSAGRRLLQLPVPSRSSYSTDNGSAAAGAADVGSAAGGGTACADEAAGRAPCGWDVPHALAWRWLRGAPSARGRLTPVELSHLSALHGVSESAAAAAARRGDSGRRYAAAASLVVYEETGRVQARVLTLLPTRALDAELMLLALAPVDAPPTLRLRRITPGGEAFVVAAGFGARGGDAPHAELAPWHITRDDLVVVNALRAACSAVALRGDAAALPSAFADFLALGDAVAARPQPPGLVAGELPDDTWLELQHEQSPQAQALHDADDAPLGPWPPFALDVLEPLLQG